MSPEYPSDPSANPIPPPPPREPAPPPGRATPEPPKKRETGCLFWSVAGLAALFFGTTLLLFIAFVGLLLARGASESAAIGDQPALVEQTIQGQGAKKILLVPVSGLITDLPRSDLFRPDPGMVATIHEMLRAARKDPDVKAVLLEIDSPGGGITASDVIYRDLKLFHDETGKDVVALLGDVAASGGYYVAAAAQHIVAHPTTVTGSIGVIMPLIGLEDLFAKIGVRARPIKSAPMKDIGSVFRDMTPGERAMLQGIVDEYYNRFVDIVHDGMKSRGLKITREELLKHCDGSVFTGEQAKKIGFADETGYFEEAVLATCKRADIARSEARIITYRRKPGLLEAFLARSPAPQAQGLTLRLQGMAGGDTPRFLYLWSAGQPVLQITAPGAN